MPITPLHFGLLAPVNHYFPGKVSLVSFAVINLWMDGNAILYYGFGIERAEELHAPMTHSFVAAVILASLVAVMGFKSRKWVLGAYFGGLTHVLLDMLVHSDMAPFYPVDGNPFNYGLMQPLSLILLPFMIWFIVQTTQEIAGKLKARWQKTG